MQTVTTHRPRRSTMLGGRRAPATRRDASRTARGSRIGFVAAATSLVAVFAASASPIPLYDLYRRTDGLTHADLALTAVAYFVAVMAALVVMGRLSDHLGRRPVVLAALALTAAGCLVLTQVHSVGPLILGRVLQGLGCGLASSALTAFVVDSAPARPSWLASAVTTGSPMVGLTLGALASGALAGHGRSLVYLVASAVLAACAGLVLAGRETAGRAAGALDSLRPRVHVPAGARRLLFVAGCTFVATWALGGFYQAFGPSVTAEQLGTSSPLLAAVVFASYMAPSALGAALAGRTSPARAQRAGMVLFALAVVALLGALHAGSVIAFLVASAVAGAAQGGTFAAGMRSLLAEAGPQDRAATLSAIYLTSYAGAAVPGFIAGQLSHTLGLFDIALGYGALAIVACAITVARARDPRALLRPAAA